MDKNLAIRSEIKSLKRSDLIAEEIKRLITEKDLNPGDRLPRDTAEETP